MFYAHRPDCIGQLTHHARRRRKRTNYFKPFCEADFQPRNTPNPRKGFSAAGCRGKAVEGWRFGENAISPARPRAFRWAYWSGQVRGLVGREGLVLSLQGLVASYLARSIGE